MLDARSGRDPTYSTSGDYHSEVMMLIKTKILRVIFGLQCRLYMMQGACYDHEDVFYQISCLQIVKSNLMPGFCLRRM